MTDLTEEEKNMLMEDLIGRREDFGTRVSTYIAEVDNETEQIVLDLTTKLSEIED